MTHSITISQGSGLFKKAPDFSALKKEFSGALTIGGIGRFFEFEELPGAAGQELEAAYMLYGTKSILGRGFYLYIAKGFSSFEVTIPLPTTRHDLEDMFAFAGHLAQYLGVRQIMDNNVAYPRSYLPALYPDVAKANQEILQSYAVTRPGFTVSGVRFPVQVPPQVCKRIASVPAQNTEPFLADILEKTQRISAAYLKPEFLRDENTQAPTGRYSITEGQSYLVPKHPFVPYGPSPFGQEEVSLWQVDFMSTYMGYLGALPYDTFLERLTEKEKREVDDTYYIIPVFDLRRLQEIIQAEPV